jgi:hypothetical protein
MWSWTWRRCHWDLGEICDGWAAREPLDFVVLQSTRTTSTKKQLEGDIYFLQVFFQESTDGFINLYIHAQQKKIVFYLYVIIKNGRCLYATHWCPQVSATVIRPPASLVLVQTRRPSFIAPSPLAQTRLTFTFVIDHRLQTPHVHTTSRETYCTTQLTPRLVQQFNSKRYSLWQSLITTSNHMGTYNNVFALRFWYYSL